MPTNVVDDGRSGVLTVGCQGQMEKVQLNMHKQCLPQHHDTAIPNILLESFTASFFLPTTTTTTTATTTTITRDYTPLASTGNRHLDKQLTPSSVAAVGNNPDNLRSCTQQSTPGMERNGLNGSINGKTQEKEKPLEWDWVIEQADRQREARIDASLHGATPFEVDRKVLKDVVREKMNVEVVRIEFLSSGTFHKAYLVILADRVQLVARVARRFMPRLKTESEVATMQYLRENTNVPVPTIYHYDSNPFNRLGGEYILMSKAKGVPLSKVYHSLPYNDLVKLFKNMAAIIIPLFAHRFPALGSLYFGPDPRASTSKVPTPKAVQTAYPSFPFSSTLGMTALATRNPSPSAATPTQSASTDFHVGPIISWPFFGSNRGELSHPNEINRGPWSSTKAYVESCVDREVKGVIRENEGKAAPHKLHLDPDEIRSSRHHQLKAVPDDQSDDSDEWDLEESEDEWEGPGDAMYRDYRRMQRTTFLVAHLTQREDCVKEEMARWVRIMNRLIKQEEEARSKAFAVNNGKGRDKAEEFGLDCHDLSLENVFVDAEDPTRITSIIDWESTTTRPLWQCAHLPAFLQSSPFTAKLFREVVVKMATETSPGFAPPPSSETRLPPDSDFVLIAREWLYYEAAGMRMRMAHRCVEWDGWEEGLAESMLGAEEFEDDWFKEGVCEEEAGVLSPPLDSSIGKASGAAVGAAIGNEILAATFARRKASTKIPLLAKEVEKENMLDTTGDICGGRGGELGRRLEAWLTVNGHESVPDPEKSVDGPRRRWHNEAD
ncbi:phosphotransferase family protein [Moniliophthora roreri MCA 2997]|uniref:Phosphotransferase family protein n=1 Tax=Moniliophthora roreri (strain MCA 2997) TaxID=1381753 RepID=V2WZR0_MONRO|nr:phosphotransferase family protein [Moniliophthora roreri MCA 2997]